MIDPMKITSVADLEMYAQGEVVELPPFANDQPFVARLRRPSMLALARAKKIPNSLLTKANGLFVQGVKSFDQNDENAMDDMFSLIDTICESSFIQPTYDQVRNANITLTDEQMLFVFNYSQAGVKALEPFRGEQGSNETSRGGKIVQLPTESVDGDI